MRYHCLLIYSKEEGLYLEKIAIIRKTLGGSNSQDNLQLPPDAIERHGIIVNIISTFRRKTNFSAEHS